MNLGMDDLVMEQQGRACDAVGLETYVHPFPHGRRLEGVGLCHLDAPQHPPQSLSVRVPMLRSGRGAHGHEASMIEVGTYGSLDEAAPELVGRRGSVVELERDHSTTDADGGSGGIVRVGEGAQESLDVVRLASV